MDHQYFMQQALLQAQDALLDGEFPVGCVIVHDGQIVAEGGRTNSVEANELDHAEMNGLRRLLDQKLGIPLSEVTVYATMEPCLMCYSTLVVNGVRNIVYAYEDAMGGGTDLELSRLAPLYKDVEMNIVERVMRQQSLALFKEFFALKGEYLKDSFLAQYTLSQK